MHLNAKNGDVMINQISPCAMLILAAITLLILTPLFIFMLPLFIVTTFLYDAQNLLMIPPAQNFYLWGIGFLLLIAMLLFLAYKRTKIMYIFNAVLLIAAISCMYFASLSYTQVHPNFITIKNFQEKKTYPFQSIKRIDYKYGAAKEDDRYIFETKTGEIFMIAVTPLLNYEKKQHIYHIAHENQIEFNEKPID